MSVQFKHLEDYIKFYNEKHGTPSYEKILVEESLVSLIWTIHNLTIRESNSQHVIALTKIIIMKTGKDVITAYLEANNGNSLIDE